MYEYGCWITDKGEDLDIDRSYGHLETVFRYHDEKVDHSQSIDVVYGLAYEAGWVRVVCGYGDRHFTADFGAGNITKAALSRLKRLLRRFWKNQRGNTPVFFLRAEYDTWKLPEDHRTSDLRSALQFVESRADLQDDKPLV